MPEKIVRAMPHFEYVYLTLAGMCIVFLGLEAGRLSPPGIVLIAVAAGIFAFMFAFRRQQSRLRQAREREEMRAMEEEADQS
jgi:Ca2+/Na+ antiporter